MVEGYGGKDDNVKTVAGGVGWVGLHRKPSSELLLGVVPSIVGHQSN